MSTPKKLRIIGDGLAAWATKIYIDDLDISDMVKSVAVSFDVGEVNQAVITFLPGKLEVNAEVVAQLNAALKVSALEWVSRQGAPRGTGKENA